MERRGITRSCRATRAALDSSPTIPKRFEKVSRYRREMEGQPLSPRPCGSA